MRDANLYRLMRRRFPADLDQPCLLLPGGATVTYRTLDARSAQIAHALVSAGCVAGDRVAAQVEKSATAVCLYLACLRAGLVYLPLNTGYQQRELSYFLLDAKPRVIVCSPDAMGSMSAIATPRMRIFTLDDRDQGSLINEIRTCFEDFKPVPLQEGDLAAILYTSGTTGRSKGAMLSHGNLAANALTLGEYWAFSAADVLYHALPIYHVHGLFVAIHCVLLSGSRMWFCPRFDVKEALELLPRSSVMMGVPTFYTRLLANPEFGRKHCATVRVFISGSAPLLPETFASFEERTGVRILERYGMTETGMNTSNPLFGERIGGTVGPPLPGVSVRVTGADGKSVPAGDIGGIEVKGPNVFRGYWGMPEKTAEDFTADGFFRTGDMGRLPANGYLQIVGRAKDLIITGGLNVYPKEIEELIDSLPGVLESAVIGIPHPDFGEAVTAVVVAQPNARLTSNKIIAALKPQLAGFKMPKYVYMVADLPRNTMGKVQKNILRQQYEK
ncbi:MAG: malonyl-CoA synthase [Betaproteobacteria bacterium]|nr:malonyl-CoA synthase [Betaproteobacteria bacterium]